MGKDTAARVLIMVKLWVGVNAYTLYVYTRVYGRFTHKVGGSEIIL